MKKIKNINVPIVLLDNEQLQQLYCNGSVGCPDDDCCTCLFELSNLEAFTDWYYNGAYRNEEIKDTND